MRILNHRLVSLLLLAIAAACRGQLPPTQPPPRIQQDVPETTTNDAPTAGPLAVDAASSGGTNLLPVPTLPAGGSNGSGGSANLH